MIDPIKAQKSINWLRDNYASIWFNSELNVDEKAGILSAYCDPKRCYLMTLDLRDRLDAIKRFGFNELNAVMVTDVTEQVTKLNELCLGTKNHLTKVDKEGFCQICGFSEGSSY